MLLDLYRDHVAIDRRCRIPDSVFFSVYPCSDCFMLGQIQLYQTNRSCKLRKKLVPVLRVSTPLSPHRTAHHPYWQGIQFAVGLEPTIDVISRINYESTVYKIASLHSHIGDAPRSRTQRLYRSFAASYLYCSLGLATHLNCLRQFRCIHIWTMCTIEIGVAGKISLTVSWRFLDLLLKTLVRLLRSCSLK